MEEEVTQEKWLQLLEAVNQEACDDCRRQALLNVLHHACSQVDTVEQALELLKEVEHWAWNISRRDFAMTAAMAATMVHPFINWWTRPGLEACKYIGETTAR